VILVGIVGTGVGISQGLAFDGNSSSFLLLAILGVSVFKSVVSVTWL
jgi:hypothetical protein